MKLNEQKLEAIFEAISAKGINQNCNICSKGKYEIELRSYQLPLNLSGTVTPPMFPIIALVCNSCSNVILFDQRKLLNK